MKYNSNFDALENSYVFTRINESVRLKRAEGGEVIDLGIGDVKLPLFHCAVTAMKLAAEELSSEKTFRGYMPSEGLLSLREKIAKNYNNRAIDLLIDEIFVTDGAKSDLGNLLELFGGGAEVLIPQPCYPAYAEANILYGNKVTFLSTSAADDFIPYPPYGEKFDVIFLCSPNNPTGTVFDRETLKAWIDYALSTDAVIIFDGAYSIFTENGYPKSVYEIAGAKNCAIEVRSFSKSFGFTGIRCGYTVIPKTLGKYNALYKRRLGARFNGVSYITQRGAETFFSAEGGIEAQKRAAYYIDSAEILRISLKKVGIYSVSASSSPYVFAKCLKGGSSAEFCEKLLDKTGIAATPGSGFGKCGEGYFRLSAFRNRAEILKAADKLASIRFDFF